MFHLDNNSGVSAMPKPAAQQSAATRWFSEGDGGNNVSWPGMDWFNIVQAELLNTLVAAGIAPDKTKFNQLALSIKAIINKDALLKSNLLGEIKTTGASGQKTARENLDITDATLNKRGLVQLSNATDSASEVLAATPKAVKSANDNASGRVARSGDTMTGQLKIRSTDALRIYDAAYGMIFRRSETNFYLIPTAKDQGENGGIGPLRPLIIELASGRMTLGNGAIINGGLGLGTANGLGGNSIVLGDNDTGFKQNGDGVLDVYANSRHVMRHLSSGITSNVLLNMNAGSTVSGALTVKNGGSIVAEKTGANPRNGRIYWGGDASRGNRVEFADDAGWKAYIERHPTSGVQLSVNGRIIGSFIYSSGEVQAGGGKARFAADGNIFGSKWGNVWLDTYLARTYQPKGNYTPAGQAYTKAESDGRYYTRVQSDARYNLKNTATKSANAMTHKDASTGVMEVVMSNITVGPNTNVNVKFSTAFPSVCVGVVITYDGSGHGSNDDSSIACVSYSRTGCVLRANNAQGKFMLIAKGY